MKLKTPNNTIMKNKYILTPFLQPNKMLSHFGLLLAFLVFGLEANAQCTPAIVESAYRNCEPIIGEFMFDFEFSNFQGALFVYDIVTSTTFPIQDYGDVGRAMIGPYSIGNSDPLLLVKHQDPSCDFIINLSAVPPCPDSCVEPSGLTATNITDTTVDLSWTENGTATQWTVEIYDTNSTGPAPGFPSTTSYNATNLISNTDYIVNLRAVCGSGASMTSSNVVSIPFTTLAASTILAIE